MELFSRKYKLQRPSVDLIYESVPEGVRIALFNFLSAKIAFGDHASWMRVQKEIFNAPKVRTNFELEPLEPHARSRIKQVLEHCEWDSFLDICQLLAALFDKDFWKSHHSDLTGEILKETINEIFADNYLGYELKDSRIEKLGAPFVDEQISQVRQVLQNPEYSGPNEQFEKAIGFLNQRPKPDTANCVKDAVGAVEALARIVTGNESAVLSTILDREPLRSEIHSALRQMMHKLYAYRGDAEGAAHGQTSIGQITVEEAELALGVSASCMIYLAKKFGEGP